MKNSLFTLCALLMGSTSAFASGGGSGFRLLCRGYEFEGKLFIDRSNTDSSQGTVIFVAGRAPQRSYSAPLQVSSVVERPERYSSANGYIDYTMTGRTTLGQSLELLLHYTNASNEDDGFRIESLKLNGEPQRLRLRCYYAQPWEWPAGH